jgi:SsrA-binding protein
MKDCYAVVKNSEMVLLNLHINPYIQANIFNHDPRQPRKLLLHKREILRLAGKVKEKGLTLIPLSIYLKGSRIKVELGLAKGRAAPDKKQAIKERDVRRDMQRELKNIGR